MGCPWYADQDDEERELRMLLLGSKAPKRNPDAAAGNADSAAAADAAHLLEQPEVLAPAAPAGAAASAKGAGPSRCIALAAFQRR